MSKHIAQTERVNMIGKLRTQMYLCQTENTGNGRAEDSASGGGLLPVFRRGEEGAAHHLKVSRGNHIGGEENRCETGTC